MINRFLQNFTFYFRINLLVLVFFTVLFSGCATTEKPSLLENREANSQDPYEGFNRSMYQFNDTLDSYLFEPIVDGYKWITPDLLETGVSNVFQNMQGVSVLLNDFLQGKFQQGAKDTGRFLLNSTVGVGGIFDIATHAGLEQNDEDFGQTLAVWGVPRGPFLVLPVLGPSTFRGIPGAVVDAAANPVSYLGWPVAAMAALDKRASEDGSLQFIDEAAVDPYVFTREAYLQHREYLATDGAPEYNNDDFLEDPEDNEIELLSDAGDIEMESNEVRNIKPKAAKVPEKDKNSQIKPVASSDASVKKTDVKQQEQKALSPEFEKAMHSFKKATKTYHRADKELELIKKGIRESK